MNSQHTPTKNEFQLERIALFSDAVFAIAITLLVIEIKVPEVPEELTDKALLHELWHLVPKFMGFIISFFIIGMYWRIHHSLFGFITAYNRKLLVLNLFFLFTIVLMPFSTGFFGEYSSPRTMHLVTPVIFYAGNVCMTGIINYFLHSYAGNPANHIARFPDERYIATAKRRALIVPLIFFLCIPVAFYSGWLARYVPILIPIALRLFGKHKYQKISPAQIS